MSNTHLAELLASEPPEIRDEIVRINTEARPIALQVALLPLVAGLLGLWEFLPDEPPARYQTRRRRPRGMVMG